MNQWAPWIDQPDDDVIMTPEQSKRAAANVARMFLRDYNPNHEPAGSSKGGQFASGEESANNFKKWFGNSKVRDEDGNPLVLYHATSKQFDEFKPGGFDPELSGPAIWLSPYKDIQPAMHNTGGGGNFKEGTHVIPVYVRAENPLVLDDKEMLDWAKTVYANGSSEFPLLISSKTAKELQDDGYDSIFYDAKSMYGRDKENEWIVFDGNQLKSAISNTGNYSRKHNKLHDYNPNHYPAGTEGSKGGQFAPGEGAEQKINVEGDEPNTFAQFMTDEMWRRMKNSIAVAKAMPETYHINDPQRLAMREAITDKLYNRDIDKRVQGREATIILGLPGAGKSTLANPLIKAGAIEIDPDIVKQEIPEFNGGIGANAVHEESSAISKQILARAIANGDNIVWPRIDGKDKLERDIKTLHANGYKVHVAIIDVSQETAIKSAIDRFEHTGRLVSPSTILEYGDTPEVTYQMAKAMPNVTVARYRREHGKGVEAVLGDGVLQIVRDGVVVAEYAADDFTIKMLDFNPYHDPETGRFTSGWFKGTVVVRRKGRKHSVREMEVFAEHPDDAEKNLIESRKAIALSGDVVTVEGPIVKVREDTRRHPSKYPNRGSKEHEFLQEMQKRYEELGHKGD